MAWSCHVWHLLQFSRNKSKSREWASRVSYLKTHPAIALYLLHGHLEDGGWRRLAEQFWRHHVDKIEDHTQPSYYHHQVEGRLRVLYHFLCRCYRSGFLLPQTFEHWHIGVRRTLRCSNSFTRLWETKISWAKRVFSSLVVQLNVNLMSDQI